MKGPVGLGSSFVGLPPSQTTGAAPFGAEVGEDWSRSGHNTDIMESQTKESKPDTRKDTEEDETDDELVIEECESGAPTKGGSAVKEPEPAPELTGKFRIMYGRREGGEGGASQAVSRVL